MKDSAVGSGVPDDCELPLNFYDAKKINVNFVKFISEICDKNIFYKHVV